MKTLLCYGLKDNVPKVIPGRTDMMSFKYANKLPDRFRVALCNQVPNVSVTIRLMICSALSRKKAF